ncbi:phosphatase PAP2 family protein [Ginsengibacter hankyongi]|uniref:Phosphatase PAP2 family protein n=1 Tax=Ginsengibacter hankyongi TaxID=2607284 RepID=A0A5J5IAV4_9BACT|nr:phosphatase PAP2 family protein [Ginsengibacter hankyongi]KAA9035868.1 phosphatase PAP2 family protein [Ginsengibacter hankyongi]
MATKYLCVLMISILVNLRVFGQVIHQIPQNLQDTSAKQYNHTNNYLKPNAFIIPGAFLVYSGLKPIVSGIQKLDDTIYSNIKLNHPGFHTNAEDYLMWTPSASVYLLDAFKAKTRHTFKEHLILDAGSIVITGGVGYAMRLISRHINAYTTHDTKFPSGHTANAFRGAEMLHQELKDNNRLLSYSGYLIATSVGILRLYNKDHLLTEVIAGAGLGILSTKLTYWIFDKVKYKNRRNPISIN